MSLSAAIALPDTRAARRAFDRANAFDAASVVHDEARRRLLERLTYTRVAPEVIAELGAATGRGGGGSGGMGRPARRARCRARSGIRPGSRAVADGPRLSAGALAHASDFSWHRTAEGLLATYRDAFADRLELPMAVNS